MSDEGFSMLKDSDLYRLFRQCKQLNALALVHAENGALIQEVCLSHHNFNTGFIGSLRSP